MNIILSLFLLSVLVDPLPPNNLLEWDVWFVHEGTEVYPFTNPEDNVGWSFLTWTETPSPTPELEDDFSASLVCMKSGFCLVKDYGEVPDIYTASLYQTVIGQGAGSYRFGVYYKQLNILDARWKVYGHDQEDVDQSQTVAYLETLFDVSHTGWPTRTGSNSPQAEPVWMHSGWRTKTLPDYPYYSVVLFVELDNNIPVDELTGFPKEDSCFWSTGWYFGKTESTR